jgi:hypothetical protein
VTAAADQHSVQSMTRSSNPHGTPALPGLVGVAVGPETLARAPSPTISLRETDPATPAERVLLACFPLAHNGPLGHVGRPDERAEERALTGLLCWSGLPGRQHAGTIGPVRRRFANGGVAGRTGGEPFPSKSFAADGAGSKHGDR